jgi:hypothetical protein
MATSNDVAIFLLVYKSFELFTLRALDFANVDLVSSKPCEHLDAVKFRPCQYGRGSGYKSFTTIGIIVTGTKKASDLSGHSPFCFLRIRYVRVS